MNILPIFRRERYALVIAYIMPMFARIAINANRDAARLVVTNFKKNTDCVVKETKFMKRQLTKVDCNSMI